MPFYPTNTPRIVGSVGNPSAKIALIGEALGAQEDKTGIPFSGPAGGVLDSCLHSANLIRSDIYITNLVKIKPRNNDISPYYSEPRGNQKTGSFTAAGLEWVHKLWEELQSVSANVVVPLGRPAMLACMGTDRVSQFRGYVFEGRPEIQGRKVIPTYHPAATLRGQYIWRYYISHDLAKAKAESSHPGVHRPERDTLWPDTFKEALAWLDYFESCERLSIDIEVINFEVSCICLADSPTQSVSFPMYWSPEPKWSVAEEAMLWRRLATILGHPKIVKIFQNGIFDIHFLAMRCGIIVAPLTPEMIEDTMIGHHIMFPEMLKGLGFLGSLYCGSQAYWKNMVKFQDIKENS
jgi:uracil-DNA glycosylase family 4